jgi:predicted secreted hydrolase
VIPRSGAPRYLAAADFAVRATRRWRSAASGAVYPSRWEVAVPSERLRLTVTPLLADQENRSRLIPRLFYWEGAVGVGGDATGRGYVELVGYGQGVRPAI